MKSSFWVLGSVTLLCLGVVKCSRDFLDNDENFLDKRRDDDEERTLKDENTEWALYKARRNWNELTNEINELSSLQRNDAAACTDDMCFEGGTCSANNICTCGEYQYFDGKQCQNSPCSLTDNKINCKCPDGTIWEEGKLDCVAEEQEKRCEKDCGDGVCVKEGEGAEIKEICRCFAFATNTGNSDEGKCVLKPTVCASGEVEDNNEKCKCEGKYKQAEDEITCVFKTCSDVGNNDCNTKGETCAMNWKTGYYCTCPAGQGRKNDEDECKKICNENSDCQNEGTCEPNGSLKICSCLEGTEGPSCEIVPSCKNLLCGDDANCVYNSASKVGECRCKDKKLSYDAGDNKCKRICEDNSNCQNGGSCEPNGSLMTCSCPQGTDGPFCEIVPSCNDLTCGNDADCVYSTESKVGECRCKDKNLSYDTEDNKCKSPAEVRCNNFPCYNGGTCNGEKEEAECTCNEGFSGDHCEIFSKSKCEEKDKKCADTGGQCTSTAQGVICECPEGTSYLSSDGCKNRCENFVCYNEGQCQQGNGVPKCRCTGGFTGKKCEIFPKQKCKEEIENCDLTGGTCISEDEDKVNCTCKKDYVFVNDKGCQNIEDINCKEICGENSEVKCDGNKKIKEKIKCSCTDKTKEFDKDEKKCKISYCKEVCGAVQCLGNIFDKDQIKCNCSKPYEDFDEEKKKCKINYCKKNCGTAERVECDEENQYTDQNIKCSCDDTDYVFVKKDKKCQQKCSENSDCNNEGTCEGNEGEKVCSCKLGTIGDFCETIKECEEGKKYGKCRDGKGDCKFKGGRAVCDCTEENHKLYDDGGYCDVQCENNEDCDGNRICNEAKFCVCKKGYEGDDCDVVTGCKTLNKDCEAIGKECDFDATVPGLLATCKCGDSLKYYFKKKQCLPQCDANKNKKCEDKRVCNEDNFCECKLGYEGEDCSIVTGCKVLRKKCEEIGVDCIFDDKSGVKATCNCTKGFKYDPTDNQCKHEFCYPDNPCKKPANCTFDESNEVGFCKCPENQFYSNEAGKCKGFDDKCLLRKTPCGKNEACNRNTGKCECKGKIEGEECKLNFCDKKPCFKGANCSEDGTCFCVEGKYYKNKACNAAGCNIKNYKTACTCPVGKREKQGEDECVIQDKDKCENMTEKDCGYGLCKKVNRKDSCKCFDFAENKVFNGTCTLKKEFCASGMLQKNDPMKCKCEGKYKQADDGITCTLKTCEDNGVKEECESLGGKCVMNWKGNGYDCECPEGYDKDENGKCSDPCSIQKNIKICTDKGMFCYNSFSTNNQKTVSCNCPPTVELVNGICIGKAANAYLFKNIPVLKEKYELKSGINKVLLNKHLIQSLQETFKQDLYEFGYLFDYNVQGDVVYCSVWVNFKKAPKEEDLKIIKTVSNTFSGVCDDCDDSVMIWPPNVFLSSTGLKEVEPDKQDFCKVKDRLCGKGAKCTEDKDKNGKCTCDDGYQVVQYGSLKIGPHEVQVCEDINECALGTHKCPKNTECFNTIGNYSCVCKEGFKKENPPADPETDKSDCVDLCTPSPCKKGKCVIDEKGKTFDCECEPGVAGSYCQRADEHYKSAKKSTVVVGAVLGTILIVGAIAVIYFIIKKKKRFGSEDFMPAPRMDHAEMTERRHIRGVTNKGYE